MMIYTEIRIPNVRKEKRKGKERKGKGKEERVQNWEK